MKEHKMLERSESLKQLYKKIKSDNNMPFFNQFLEGAWKYHTLQERRKTIKAELEYPSEKEGREKLIELGKEVQYFLYQAEKKLELLDLSEDIKKYFDNYIRKYTHFTEMQLLYQQTIIYMHDAEFDKAKSEAERGLKRATLSEDINQFAGLKSEAEAYNTIISKRWWEISSEDFSNTVKMFSRAVDCYSRCKRANEYEFENKTTSMPKAIISLLSFIASPTFDNVNHLVEFVRIRDKYPVVQYAFTPARKASSERKKQRDLIMQYLKNETYKIAAFNIFEDFRTMVIELERFAHKNPFVCQKAKEIDPGRASLYMGDHPPAIENFREDCRKIFGDEFPQSVDELTQIYHDCKHKKVFVTITSEPDKFAEELVNRILVDYAILKNVKKDINYLKELFTAH
jgi:hypothetical protein